MKIIERIRVAWNNYWLGVGGPMKKITKAIKRDKDYAYSWHCNIAMSFVDEGGDHDRANRAAGRFMQMLFGVDTYKIHQEYTSPPPGITKRPISPRLQKVLDSMERESKKPPHGREVLKESANYIVIKAGYT